jgi:hypothetical protein
LLLFFLPLHPSFLLSFFLIFLFIFSNHRSPANDKELRHLIQTSSDLFKGLKVRSMAGLTPVPYEIHPHVIIHDDSDLEVKLCHENLKSNFPWSPSTLLYNGSHAK